MVEYSEASELAARILAAAGLGGYRFNPPKQGTNVVSFHLADGTRGLFMAARGAATKNADDYAGTVIANWSEFCKGESISGKQAVPSTDGSVVRRIVTTCRMGSEATVSEISSHPPPKRLPNGTVSSDPSYCRCSGGERRQR